MTGSGFQNSDDRSKLHALVHSTTTAISLGISAFLGSHLPAVEAAEKLPPRPGAELRLDLSTAQFSDLRVLHRQAGPNLVIMGGGDPTRDSLRSFTDVAGGDSARILICSWPSSQPHESETYWQGMLEANLNPSAVSSGSATIEILPRWEEALKDPQSVVDCVGRATGIFISGGKQGRAMDLVMARPEIREAFTVAARRGVAFGGSSAGAAMMSEVMIRGPREALATSPHFNTESAHEMFQCDTFPGLGVLPNTWIVDQHFSERFRAPRLLWAMRRYDIPGGIGIDENTALTVIGGRYGQVTGEGTVRIFRSGKSASESEIVLVPGDIVDLEALIPKEPHKDVAGESPLQFVSQSTARAVETTRPEKPTPQKQGAQSGDLARNEE